MGHRPLMPSDNWSSEEKLSTYISLDSSGPFDPCAWKPPRCYKNTSFLCLGSFHISLA